MVGIFVAIHLHIISDGCYVPLRTLWHMIHLFMNSYKRITKLFPSNRFYFKNYSDPTHWGILKPGHQMGGESNDNK